MKKLFLLPLLGAIAIFGTSCYSSHHPNTHAKRGTVVGGIVGAGAGALIGEHNDRELEGAAVGGVIGAVTGGLLGGARDEENYYRNGQRYQSPPPARRYQQYQEPYYRPAPRYYPSHSSYHYHHYSRPSYRSSSYRSRSNCY